MSESLVDRGLTIFKRTNFTWRSFIARNPSVWLFYQPYLWLGQHKRRRAGHDPHEGLLLSDTKLVIDGFQGSANSFAVKAFKGSQKSPVRLMHHRHAPVLIIKAIERQIPVILTIRSPIDTALSLMRRWPYVSAKQALQGYLGFYKCLLPYSEGFILSDFPHTTKGLDKVVKAVNFKFNTNFCIVDVAMANQKHLEKKSKILPEEVLRIKEFKESRKAEIYSSGVTLELLEAANALYREYQRLGK